MKTNLISPVLGTVKDIAESSDFMFAEKILGDGIFVSPTDSYVIAPCDGKINSITKSKHAITLYTDNQVPVLLHIGIDTVELNGKGFDLFVKEGQLVKAGQKLAKVDFDFIKEQGYDNATIMIIPEKKYKVDKMNLDKNLVSYEQILEVY
ncbi:hypothetical protein C2I06_18455 [Niallia circulans]|uniref:PTS sugar transporter subunit IIA n=1 Tax=Niallia circulans TaxID=1397 RepID=UPI000F44740E|nr:PTS glucose transporter subunit IIA [Niallia circulans]AYV68703.1 hypothetical protein C2I06_18455 [Niallia circulans]